MTCIIGLIDDGHVYISGDTQGTDSAFRCVDRKDGKVFKKDGVVIGFTSSYRMGQLLRYKLKVPEFRPEKLSLDEYMNTEFIDAVREVLMNEGFGRVFNNEEVGGNFLVGIGGRLFEIGGDFQVGELVSPFNAVGCGEDLAMGAMHVLTQTEGLSVEEKMVAAMDAAMTFSAGVGGSITMVSTKNPGIVKLEVEEV